MAMTIHNELPASSSEYAMTPMFSVGSLTAIKTTFVHGNEQSTGPFRLDTGGMGTMNINSAFDHSSKLRESTRLLGSSISRGVGSGIVRNDIVLIPELKLAGFILRDVPVHVELPSERESASAGGTLNMEILRRFNILLDYQNKNVYLRPNLCFQDPFTSESAKLPSTIISIILVATILLAGIWIRFSKRLRQ